MQQVNATSFRWTMDAAGDWLCIRTNKARQVIDTLKQVLLGSSGQTGRQTVSRDQE